MERRSTAAGADPQSAAEYELFVRGVTNELLRLDGLSIAAVHSKPLTGLSQQSHAIDIYWEYSLGGVLHKVAIECKNLSRNVELGHVRDFAAVLSDIPGLRGIMVTRKGFARGAKKYAKAHNISLHVTRPPTDGDYGPRIKATLVVMTFPRVREVEFEVNDAWLAGNTTVRDRLQEGPLPLTDDVVVDNRKTATRRSIQSLIPHPTSKEMPPPGKIVQTYTDAYLEFPTIGPVKIDNIEISYGFERLQHRMDITYLSAQAFVADVLSEKSFVLNQKVYVAFSTEHSNSESPEPNK
jgi:hypothetical protein